MKLDPYSQTPKVSVIIPAYNTAYMIVACLDSVLSQSYQDFEVIVVNDGSPDTSELENILQRYRAQILYIKQENKGAAAARNTAIRNSRGEFLAFLDSDDSWFPDHLRSQMQLFDDDPTLDLVYSDGIAVLNSRPTWNFMARCPSEGEPSFDALVVERCQVLISTVVARKTALVRAGLFDESLRRCDDYDLWLRAAFHGAKIGYTRQVQARLSPGRPNSLGLSSSKMSEAAWKILEKISSTLPLNNSQRDIVLKKAVAVRARYLLEEGKNEICDGRFDNARQLLSEANRYFCQRKVRLTLWGLKVAPNATGKLVGCWFRFLRARSIITSNWSRLRNWRKPSSAPSEQSAAL